MDRLPTLIALCATLTACDKQSSEPPASRTNGAKVTTSQVTVEELCDKHFPDDTGPLLKLPALVDGTLAPSSTTWRWINIWATWCKPCVEEMPRLVRSRDKLGKPVDLAFISVDEDPADIASHRADHPDTPPSPRPPDPKKMGQLFAPVGPHAPAPVPIHVFVRPSGHVACARAGSVRDRDLPAIKQLLAN